MAFSLREHFPEIRMVPRLLNYVCLRQNVNLSTVCVSPFRFFPLPTIPFLLESLPYLRPQNSSVSQRKRNLQRLGCGEEFGGEKEGIFLKMALENWSVDLIP